MIEQDALKSIRRKNISDILQVLRKKGMCSLADLTENVDGGLTTTKKCVFQAMSYGMIAEGEVADSTGGRKAKQYRINEKYQYFLFAVVDNKSLIFKIYNYSFECIKEYTVNFTIREFMQTLCENIDEIEKSFDIGTLCLSVPCVIKDGIVLDWYYNPDLVGLNLETVLKKRYRCNVIIQNDMKLTVLGESTEDKQNSNNIASVQFGHNGIGLGAMVNGHLLEGSSGFAGEIGYINDLRKDVKNIYYLSKIVRNAIVFLNPEVIVFYKSGRQNQFEQIFKLAVNGLPSYAVPRFEVSDDYINSIIAGLILLVNQYGYFRRLKEENEIITG